MNVLIISDDGPGAVGLEILQESARAHFGPSAKIITVVPKEGLSGQSFAVTPNFEDTRAFYRPVVETKPFTYEVDGTPVDCLYLGMLYPVEVLGTDVFDVVLVGVNQGSNVGVDVFHSGTVATAMLAATLFGVASIAFSQEVDDKQASAQNKREFFQPAEQFTRKVLSTHSFAPGSCLNVNFPKGRPKGYRKVPPATFSRWLANKAPNRDRHNDIHTVEDGFIAISDLELSITPAMSY